MKRSELVPILLGLLAVVLIVGGILAVRAVAEHNHQNDLQRNEQCLAGDSASC